MTPATTFVREADVAQIAWRATTTALDEVARATGTYRDCDRAVCVPREFATQNLLPDSYVAFEWIGEGNPLREWRDGVGTRGAKNTSVDAAIRHVEADGRSVLSLIEWKYAEQYVDGGELHESSTSQVTCDATSASCGNGCNRDPTASSSSTRLAS